MNKFLTLIRRDMADNRGALVITPLVIAAILLAVTTFATLTGNARFGFDPQDFAVSKEHRSAQGAMIVDTGEGTATVKRGPDGTITIISPDGKTKTLDETIDPKAKAGLEAVLPVGTAVAAALPLAIALISILFVLAGALHDERKDRTILFWKSMPVSDLQTTSAKLVSIVGVGLFFALAVTIVLHIAITGLAVATIGNVGITGVSAGAVFLNATKLWTVLAVGLLVYIGWALPVYGWVTMVSAWAPKMPFVAAFAPLFVVPLVYMAIAYRGDDNDTVLNALWEPVGRLIGEPMTNGMSRLAERSSDQLPTIPVAEILGHFTEGLAQPSFWIGLVVAGGFIYAASEIRRRRAL
jgi:ABC-2 type transport system permease protein